MSEALSAKKLVLPLLMAILALVCVQAHATLGMLGGVANGSVAPSTWLGATLPTAPTTFTPTISIPSAGSTCHGSYYTATTAANLQTDTDAAYAATCSAGDVIILTAGTNFNFTTAGGCNTGSPCWNQSAHNAGAGKVYFVSSHAPEVGGSGLPSAGTRICPSGMPGTGVHLIGCPGGANTSISDFAEITDNDTTEGCRQVQFANDVHHAYFIGIYFQCLDSNGAVRGANTFVIGVAAETSLGHEPQDVTFDRCYIAGSPIYGAGKGLYQVDGSDIAVINSYFWNIFQPGNGDTNDIWGLNGPGPFQAKNNTLYSDGETTFFGGDNLMIVGQIYRDIDIENNHFWKPQFTGTVHVTASSTTMTVASVTSGFLMPPMKVTDTANFLPDPTCSSVCTTVIQQLTGSDGSTCPATTCDGTTGTYQLSAAATGTSTTDTATGGPNGKNMIEFKEGQRILVKGNYFENAGSQGQPRSGFTATVVNQYLYTATANLSGTSITVTPTGSGVLCDGQAVSFSGVIGTPTVSGIGGCTTGSGTFTLSISQTTASGKAITGPSSSWVTIADLDVENNIFTNGLNGWGNFLLQDSAASNPIDGEGGDSQCAARWLFRNDLVLLNADDGSSSTDLTGMTSAAPGDATGSGGCGDSIIFDHDSILAANGSNQGLFFGPVNTGSSNMNLTHLVYSNSIIGPMNNKFGGAAASNQGYSGAITPQVTQPSFQSNVWVGAADASLPASNANPSAVSSVGFTSFGSATAAAGYALTTGSSYHAAGVSGANLPYNSSGTPDSTDIGANISLLPSN